MENYVHHPRQGRRFRICTVCRHRYLAPLGRPRIGLPADTCQPCLNLAATEKAEEREREDAEWIERRFEAARRYNRRTMHLTDADCYGPSTLASAVGEV
jgi:hypothetical protein